MKKSTLITTIAMIVVVVVALSTATYAWFSSGTTNTAQASMSTDAAQNWLLYGGSVNTIKATTDDGYNETTNPVGRSTISYSSSETINLALMNGLFSPSAQIGATLTSASDYAATYDQTTFFQAEQDSLGTLKANAKVKENTNKYTHTVSAQEIDNLNFVKVVNGTESDANCYLTILVYVASNNTAALLSGKAFATYIVSTSQKANKGSFNTDYYYGTITGDTAARSEVQSANRVTYSEYSSKNVKATGQGVQAVTGYTPVAAASHFGSKALAADSYYYLIKVDLGEVAQFGSINLAFYAWFDGWQLDDTASGGAVDIVFSFGGEYASVTPDA